MQAVQCTGAQRYGGQKFTRGLLVCTADEPKKGDDWMRGALLESLYVGPLNLAMPLLQRF